MQIRFLASPWADNFELLARSIKRTALLVSPYVSREPLELLSSLLEVNAPPQVDILTDIGVENLAQGSTDIGAIAAFCRPVANTRVRHLPHLHAKVYVADDKLAIVTSANLTVAGLKRNHEYGIELTEPVLVRRLSEDLRSYGDLGTDVSLLDLDRLAEIAEDLQMRRVQVLKSARRTLRQEFERRIAGAHEALLYLRAKPGDSANKIFSRTILYLLRKGPLSTQQLHPLIQQIHPDLCDDSIDRVINGVRFGKRWKHMVRNSQQSLKSLGLIEFAEGRWHLVVDR